MAKLKTNIPAPPFLTETTRLTNLKYSLEDLLSYLEGDEEAQDPSKDLFVSVKVAQRVLNGGK
jgi:hypothetical protein